MVNKFIGRMVLKFEFCVCCTNMECISYLCFPAFHFLLKGAYFFYRRTLVWLHLLSVWISLFMFTIVSLVCLSSLILLFQDSLSWGEIIFVGVLCWISLVLFGIFFFFLEHGRLWFCSSSWKLFLSCLL